MKSQDSRVSVFSNASDIDIASCNQARDFLIKLREKQSVSFELIAAEVYKMLKSCDVQRNVKLFSLTSLIQNIRSMQTEAKNKKRSIIRLWSGLRKHVEIEELIETG